METRAHHLLIGSFVLLLIGFGIGFAVWLAKIDVDRVFLPYDIYFSEAISGLSQGNSVRFKGVPVGEVKRISIDATDPSRVRVRVAIDENIPITEDTVAVLEAVGLTGVAFVQLDAGTGDSPLVTARPGEEVPVIQSRPSAIQEVFSGAPDLVNAAIVAVSRIGQLLNEENQREVSSTLKNVNVFTAGLANSSDEIERILENLDETVAEFRLAAGAINRMSGAAEELLEEDARLALNDARQAMVSMEALASELRNLLADNRANIAQFSATGLPEMTALMTDLRHFAQAATQLAEKLEQDPGSLLSATKVPEYDAKD